VMLGAFFVAISKTSNHSFQFLNHYIFRLSVIFLHVFSWLFVKNVLVSTQLGIWCCLLLIVCYCLSEQQSTRHLHSSMCVSKILSWCLLFTVTSLSWSPVYNVYGGSSSKSLFSPFYFLHITFTWWTLLFLMILEKLILGWVIAKT
jgi:hypothetical protein